MPHLIGAQLQSRIATHGTVRLVVDHSEEHYEVKVDSVYMYSDMQEIMRYLNDHDFELLPEHECPVEYNQDGSFSIWACHKQGLDFGFVETDYNIKVMLTGMAASATLILIQWLSEPMGILTEGVIFR